LFWAVLGVKQLFWAVLGVKQLFWAVLGVKQLFWAVLGVKQSKIDFRELSTGNLPVSGLALY
jgi:hypothetical protein